MPYFLVTETKKARVTLRNPNPLAMGIDAVLFIGTVQWNALGVTIPASGQVTIDFTVSMSALVVGSQAVWIGVYLAGTTTQLLYAQAEDVIVISPTVELVSVTWA